jgi:hypothetical protein
MAAFTIRPARKLAKICGLFGSEHPGERAAAAAQADKLVREYGLTWGQVISAARSHEPPLDSEPEQLIRFALGRAELLNDWERSFLTSIQGRWHLTDKQWVKLNQIVEKVSDNEDR